MGRQKTTVIPDGYWRAYGLPVPESEFRFHPVRRWRIDYAFLDVKLAIEIEGGAFMRKVKCNICQNIVQQRCRDGQWRDVTIGGRHTSSGYQKDIEKYNSLTQEGWVLLRYQPKEINYSQIFKVYQDLVERKNHVEK